MPRTRKTTPTKKTTPTRKTTPTKKTTPTRKTTPVVRSTVSVPVRQKDFRDSQRSKVYQAEKIAQHLLLGDYWAETLNEKEVLELIDLTLNHPSVIARWGVKKVEVFFPERGYSGWADRQAISQISLPPGCRNPLTVIHEVAHLLPTTRPEADHGAGFCAIYKYLLKHIIGEDASRVLDAAFASLNVKIDESQIPPVKQGAQRKRNSTVDIPGVYQGEAANAAAVIAAAIAAGVFGDKGSEMRASADKVARKLRAIDKNIPTKRPQVNRFPETITIPTGAMLDADSRSDVAEVVLSALRNQLTPHPLTFSPIDFPKN